MLCEVEKFSQHIWEPACGMGHLSEVLAQKGYDVISTDLVYRGYGEGNVDFLIYSPETPMKCDIITNPPYKYAREFVEHALEVVADDYKVCMFLKLQFLEGKKRRELFEKYPPKTVYVASGRLQCAKNGDFEKAKADGSSAIAYAWFVWQKGYSGDTVVKWIN